MGGELRLVIAEDGDLLRAGLLALLQGQPRIAVVGVATDLPGLLATVEATRPDVVLTDIRMPPTLTDEGIRAAVQLRHTHPDLGVVVLTQYTDVEYALDLVADGSQGRGYLLKERVGDVGSLIEALAEVAAGGSVIDEVVVDSLLTSGARSSGPMGRLTPRETEVLGLVARGMTNQAIAGELFITDRAVEKHINSILAKLELSGDGDVHKRVAATLVFLSEAGLGGALPGGRR